MVMPFKFYNNELHAGRPGELSRFESYNDFYFKRIFNMYGLGVSLLNNIKSFMRLWNVYLVNLVIGLNKTVWLKRVLKFYKQSFFIKKRLFIKFQQVSSSEKHYNNLEKVNGIFNIKKDKELSY